MTEKELFLELAAERFHSQAEEDWKRKDQPVIDFDPNDFIWQDEEQLVRQLGKRWKPWLCLLGSFFEEFKFITNNYIEDPSKPVTILELGTTNRNLLSIYKSKCNVSNVLKKLQDIGALVKVSDKFRFSQFERYAKKYAYNKQAEKLVLSLVKKHHINIKAAQHQQVSADIDRTFKFDPSKHFQIRVSSKLKVSHITEDEAIKALNKCYAALLKPRLKKMQKLNQTLPDEQKLRFNWNLHWSKTGFLTKVGIRMTSKIVSLKEHENENPDYTGKWRRDYLRETGFDKSAFDVHGSIYQVSHMLATGEAITNRVDPYQRIYGDMTERERMYAKSMSMCLYFDRPNCILNHNKSRIKNCLAKFGKEGLQPVINDYVDKMFAYAGKSLDSEVFFHESLVYLDFVYALKQAGIDCIQVYDGFYFSKHVSESFLEQVMSEVCRKYHDDYVKWSKSLVISESGKRARERRDIVH